MAVLKRSVCKWQGSSQSQGESQGNSHKSRSALSTLGAGAAMTASPGGVLRVLRAGNKGTLAMHVAASQTALSVHSPAACWPLTCCACLPQRPAPTCQLPASDAIHLLDGFRGDRSPQSLHPAPGLHIFRAAAPAQHPSVIAVARGAAAASPAQGDAAGGAAAADAGALQLLQELLRLHVHDGRFCQHGRGLLRGCCLQCHCCQPVQVSMVVVQQLQLHLLFGPQDVVGLPQCPAWGGRCNQGSRGGCMYTCQLSPGSRPPAVASC